MIFNQVTQENIEGNKIIKFKLNVSLKLSNHYFSPQDMMRGVQLTTSEILKLCQVKEENQVSRATKAQEDAQNMWVRAWESVMKAVILSQASPSFLLYFVIFYKHCFRCIFPYNKRIKPQFHLHSLLNFPVSSQRYEQVHTGPL